MQNLDSMITENINSVMNLDGSSGVVGITV